MPLSENELFLLSYYRNSEINGAQFFGRLARSAKPGPIQRDLTKHFADEAQHAWYWTDCLERLDARPLKLSQAYQDQYLEACGLPVNLMEVLAITLVFEQRVANQYSRHLSVPGLQPAIRQTIEVIMLDERWHQQWVREALKEMRADFGKDHIDGVLRRYRQADREIYAKTLKEHEERVDFLHAARRERT